MAYRNQNYMTNRKIKEEVDKNQAGYEAEETPIDPLDQDNTHVNPDGENDSNNNDSTGSSEENNNSNNNDSTGSSEEDNNNHSTSEPSAGPNSSPDEENDNKEENP